LWLLSCSASCSIETNALEAFELHRYSELQWRLAQQIQAMQWFDVQLLFHLKPASNVAKVD